MVKVNAKGQIVIPKSLREKYGFKPGQEVEFRSQEGRLVLVKKGLRQKIEKASQDLDFNFPGEIQGTDEFIEEMRGS